MRQPLTRLPIQVLIATQQLHRTPLRTQLLHPMRQLLKTLLTMAIPPRSLQLIQLLTIRHLMQPKGARMRLLATTPQMRLLKATRLRHQTQLRIKLLLIQLRLPRTRLPLIQHRIQQPTLIERLTQLSTRLMITQHQTITNHQQVTRLRNPPTQPCLPTPQLLLTRLRKEVRKNLSPTRPLLKIPQSILEFSSMFPLEERTQEKSSSLSTKTPQSPLRISALYALVRRALANLERL